MKTGFMAHLRYQENHVLNGERQITEVLHSRGTPYQPRDRKPTCHSKSRGQMIPVPFTHLSNPPPTPSQLRQGYRMVPVPLTVQARLRHRQ